jgi:hypothetical protein
MNGDRYTFQTGLARELFQLLSYMVQGCAKYFLNKYFVHKILFSLGLRQHSRYALAITDFNAEIKNGKIRTIGVD